MTKAVTLKLIDDLINRKQLVVWIHGTKQTFLPSAVNVCWNGDALQIEVDPDWKFTLDKTGEQS